MCLEAIGIQSSLQKLIEYVCDNKKYGISTKLFDYVLDKIVLHHKSSNYIYVYAWKVMSDILVIKYQFYKFAYGNFNNYLINRHYVDENKVDVNSIEYALLRDLKNELPKYNSTYVFTVKKI